LDIGCGWGGLIIHATQHYGAEALGITLSEPQGELARARIAEAGLAHRCRVEVRDYRDLDTAEVYDRLVSIGMVEHVGKVKLPEYFEQAWKLLRPGGVFLSHGIAGLPDGPVKTGPTFVDTHVFPDSELPPINTVLGAAESCRFEVRDLESLREHYVLTLRHWVRRLEARREEALQAVDVTTYRVWRLYMAGSAHAFAQGHLGVYQALLVKQDRGRSGLPLTRADWYAPSAKPSGGLAGDHGKDDHLGHRTGDRTRMDFGAD
jgi:cyclopropane-fatty-acyl-phospholipid synthase